MFMAARSRMIPALTSNAVKILERYAQRRPRTQIRPRARPGPISSGSVNCDQRRHGLRRPKGRQITRPGPGTPAVARSSAAEPSLGAQVLVDWACAKISEAGPLPDDQLRTALRKKLKAAGPSVRWLFQPAASQLASA